MDLKHFYNNVHQNDLGSRVQSFEIDNTDKL